MRNTNSKVRCEKRQLSKCKEVVKTYNEVQYAFADVLEGDATIKEFKRHSKARFYQDSFIEEIDFDYLEIQILDEG